MKLFARDYERSELRLDEPEHARETRVRPGFLEHAIDDGPSAGNVTSIELGIIEAVGETYGSLVVGWVGGFGKAGRQNETASRGARRRREE
jgi:hypothetical protein